MFNSPDHLPAPYDRLYSKLRSFIPETRLIRDPLRTLAYGTDASFYRLVPKLVVMVETVDEVSRLLRFSEDCGTPVTFRAAGTSLSGQAVTDSVLAVLGRGWDHCEIAQNAHKVRLGPGVIGGQANRRLAPFGRKIGPDPASINAAKIGGIAANNASGMCCGTAQNSYRTLDSMKVILADGTLLDTGDTESRMAFRQSHGALLDGLSAMARQILDNPVLAKRVRDKFKIKNTTGYSLNALVDFEDPFDILQHLMIGSEGTLGFIAEITYHTVPEYADKASSLLLFPGIAEACQAATALKQSPVSAVELMDRAALRSVENKPGMPKAIRDLDNVSSALLVEICSADKQRLNEDIIAVQEALKKINIAGPVEFTTNAEEGARLWNIRKGLFPSVGSVRPVGTTVIIEDVAFPLSRLAEATLELQELFTRHGYDEAIIFGHALEGNLHFVFTQDFMDAAEVARYARFMEDVCLMVVDGYSGSLKAEHGTGRNMAPFVQMEWGVQAYGLMKDIKALFDPEGVLNPGVILNEDDQVHLKNLKTLPAADVIIDKCIECGFCEQTCPSRDLTLTPRQRIVGWREISRLSDDGQAQALSNLYDYQGIDTCAACGLCATVCPVGIETGALTKVLRGRRMKETGRRLGDWTADHYGLAMDITSMGLKAAGLARSIIGASGLERLTRNLHNVSGRRFPIAPTTLPCAAKPPPLPTEADGGDQPIVVYAPSCAARTMGPAVNDPDRRPLPEVVCSVLEKAGYQVIVPQELKELCCGQPFESKGLSDLADRKAAEMEAALRTVSLDGTYPILLDTSPCAFRLGNFVKDRLPVHDLASFLAEHVLSRLKVTQCREPVALHVTCSTRKMGLEAKLRTIAEACTSEVVIPDGMACCGFAGDKGFTTPELNESALAQLKPTLGGKIREGYSTSRTCEIGLSRHGGIPYRSIVYLLDRCSLPET